MAGKVTKSVLAKLGTKLAKAHEENKDKETIVQNYGAPPAGIEGGVAQLTEIRFGEYKSGDNQGKPFVMFIGIIQEPALFNGMRISGMRTTQGPIPLCDTPKANKRKTLSDNLGHMYDILRPLGVDTSTLHHTQIESTCAELVEEGPYFMFRTYKLPKSKDPKYKDSEPKVMQDWLGLVNDYTPQDQAAQETVDESEVTDDEPEEEEEAPKGKAGKGTKGGKDAKPAGNGKGGKKAAPEPEPEPEEEDEEVESEEDEDDDTGDEGEEEGEGEEDEEGGEEPSVGDTGYFVSPKTKKKVQVEVTVVNDDGTVNIKSLVDGKTVWRNVNPEMLTAE